MPGQMVLTVFDVSHGACAMLTHNVGGRDGRLAMIDSGCSESWRPSAVIRGALGRSTLDYLFITNADQDHMSDLQGLWDANINIKVLYRNPSYSPDQMRQIKGRSGSLTRDAERYVDACATFNQPVIDPFNVSMGGIGCKTYWNSYPYFTDTNDLSLVVFITYAGCTFLFPGDLEKPGWSALLQRPDFCADLREVDVFVASHHGRENGYCADVFDYVRPQAIIISDKAKVYATQETVPDYRAVTSEAGVVVRTSARRRHVLTTRRDGSIQFVVNSDGTFHVDTECAG